MKKLKSILTLVFTLGFVASVTFTSCGGKKDGAEDTTEQVEDEHPAESSEHQTEAEEHPADGDNTEHPAN